MTHGTRMFFLRTVFCAVFFVFAVFAVSANPLYTPGVNKNSATGQSESGASEQAETQKDDSAAKHVQPVRVSGVSLGLMRLQGNFREKLGDLFYSLKHGDDTARNHLRLLFLFSFVYGMLHAAGPGHRKTIVFSLYIARPAPWWEPFFTACVLALLHGGTAVVLILILKGITASLGAAADKIGIYLEGFSYMLIICTSLFLLIKESFVFFVKGKYFCAGETQSVKNISLVSLFISGLYPCPGAVLVLILAYTLNMIVTGIVCVFIMSLGMAVPMCAAGYLAWAGRSSLFAALKKNGKVAAILSFAVEAFGYILILLFSLYIALPFFKSLFV